MITSLVAIIISFWKYLSVAAIGFLPHSGKAQSPDTVMYTTRANASIATLTNLINSKADTNLVKLSGGGNINITSLVVKDYLSTITTFTPTTGNSITLVKGTNMVKPIGSLLALTAVFPASPSEGDIIRVVFTQTITTLTMAGNGNNLMNALTSTINGVNAGYQFLSGTWYKLQ